MASWTAKVKAEIVTKLRIILRVMINENLHMA